MVDPQDAPEGVGEFLDPVADAGVAELTEEGKILADLRIVDRQARAKLVARNRRQALATESFELAKVQAHAADDGLGCRLIANRSATRVPQRGALR